MKKVLRQTTVSSALESQNKVPQANFDRNKPFPNWLYTHLYKKWGYRSKLLNKQGIIEKVTPTQVESVVPVSKLVNLSKSVDFSKDYDKYNPRP